MDSVERAVHEISIQCRKYNLSDPIKITLSWNDFETLKRATDIIRMYPGEDVHRSETEETMLYAGLIIARKRCTCGAIK